MNYLPIIGLEVHIELKTKSKMFCGCSADYFGKEPNTYTCAVCLGLPGALPVPNKTAIEWCIMLAHALNCKINNFSKFDRKNYFYPDLPKGYQISQYDLPFGIEGKIILKNGKIIRIRRVHMEEDTGKLIHQTINNKQVSLIDFNRSGVPLVEIVTEPDFSESSEVTEYLQKLRSIVRYLDVSNADMEKGDMRLEPNISVQKFNEHNTNDKTVKLPPYKVEVKNINSFKFVEKAITFEIKRQISILKNGQIPLQETRGWDEKKGITFSQRVKEEAMDYRYFPEPDIPPLNFTNEQISAIKDRLPELREEKILRFIKQYDLSEYDAEILTREKTTADLFEITIKKGQKLKISPKQIANFIINKKLNEHSLTPDNLINVIINETQKEEIPEQELIDIINQVINENKKAVNDYKMGKEASLMFLVGQTLRKIGKRVDAQYIKNKIKSMI